MSTESEKKGIEASFKSMDTEEFLDIYFNRPIGYAWALFFKKLKVHPNVVTIFSIILGIGAGVMFYTGISRSADGILAKQSAETSEKLDVLNYMRNQANDMKCLLNEEGFNIKFAEMLHDGWQKKKSIINSISNNDIDSYYNLALEAGASGGKLLGAGGGGFILVYCDEQYQKAVREAVGLYELNFRIARYGSRVVYFA